MSKITFKNDIEIIRQAQNGNNLAMEEIYLSNMGLIKSIARRFINRGVEFDDLVQIGTIGMLKAVNRFDDKYNCVFSTYAVPLIIGEIKKYLRDDGLIKISRDIKKNAKDILSFSTKYKQKNGYEPTTDVIKKELGLSDEEIVFALNSAKPIISLQEKKEEESMSVDEIIGEDYIEKSFDNIFLNEVMEKLNDNEKNIIKLRYFKCLTQSQTAKILGISQVKVSRDERKIFEKIKMNFY